MKQGPLQQRNIITQRGYFLPRIISAAFSPIMIDGAFVFPDTMFGIMDASATRNPEIPFTLKHKLKNIKISPFCGDS